MRDSRRLSSSAAKPRERRQAMSEKLLCDMLAETTQKKADFRRTYQDALRSAYKRFTRCVYQGRAYDFAVDGDDVVMTGHSKGRVRLTATEHGVEIGYHGLKPEQTAKKADEVLYAIHDMIVEDAKKPWQPSQVVSFVG